MSNFITELRERRVLPAVGVYAAGCWVVVEIVDRLVERHHLSPDLTDLVFWGLYSLIPAVLLVAWSYGRPGKDTATTAQKIGVPINIIATTGLLFTLYGDANLGATAEVVTFVDEEGVAGEAVVPKDDFRQRLAVFFFDNETGDPELDWLQYGVAELLTQDLQQDRYISAVSPYAGWGGGYYGRLKAAGYEQGLGAPVSLLRDIARDANRQFFVEGSIAQTDGGLVFETRLWDAGSMVQVAQTTQQGWDIYQMLDDTSVALREALEVPSVDMRGQDGMEDLPLAETYGESEQALRKYLTALNLRLLENDIAGAIAALDETLEEDPNFVRGYFFKASMLAETGNLPATIPPLEQAQRLDFRLPERDRATLKMMYYRATGQSEKLLEFLRLQARLVDDGTAHARLAQHLMVTGDLDGARHHYETALQRDPLNVPLYLVLSDLAQSQGDSEAALEFARAYQTERPKEMGASLKLGDLLRDSGELEDAQREYEQAALIDSNAVEPLLSQHTIALRRGDLEQAEQLLQEAFRTAQTSAQRATVHTSAFFHALRLGRINDAVEQMRAAEPLINETQPPFATALSVHSSISAAYLRIGRIADARAVLVEAQALVPEPPLSQFLAAIEVSISATEGNFESARQALKEFQDVLVALDFKFLAFQVPMLSGTILMEEGKYAEAAAQLRLAIEELDSSFVAGAFNAHGMSGLLAVLARAETLAGELDDAEKTLERGFRIDPNSPDLWAARALLQDVSGLNELALESANYALTIWSDADPELAELQELRGLVELLAEPGA